MGPQPAMQAAVYVAPNRVELRVLPVPQIGPGELLVRTWGTGLCGTDINKIRHGAAEPGAVLGHELVGWVAQVGEGVVGFRVGDRIAATHHVPCFTCHFCLHGSYSMCSTFRATSFDPGGFAEYVRLSASHVRHATFRLPDEVGFAEGIFLEPLACSLRAVQRAGVQRGDLVWIVGVGPSGLLLVLAASLQDARVVVSDLLDSRLTLARQLGVELAANAVRDDLPAIVRRASGGLGADVVVLTVPEPRVLAQAMASVRPGGTILVFAGTPGQPETPLDLYALWRHEINLVSSYSPDPRALEQAFYLIGHGRVPVARIPTDEVGLDGIERAIAMAVKGEVGKVIVRIGGL